MLFLLSVVPFYGTNSIDQGDQLAMIYNYYPIGTIDLYNPSNTKFPFCGLPKFDFLNFWVNIHKNVGY